MTGTLAAIGAGFAVIGAGVGIGRSGSAMEAIAKQPEAANKIQTAMIIAAALIEELHFLPLLLLLLLKNKTLQRLVEGFYQILKDKL